MNQHRLRNPGGRQPRQQQCQKCVRWCAGECAMSSEVDMALSLYAKENGVRWRARLRAEWMTATCSEHLQAARNILGPRRLAKYIPLKQCTCGNWGRHLVNSECHELRQPPRRLR